MLHGMLKGAVPTGVPDKPEKPEDKPSTGVPTGMPPQGLERWIVAIQGGVVTLEQQLKAGMYVVRAHDLPALAANCDAISDQQAREIIRAVRGRPLFEDS